MVLAHVNNENVCQILKVIIKLKYTELITEFDIRRESLV